LFLSQRNSTVETAEKYSFLTGGFDANPPSCRPFLILDQGDKEFIRKGKKKLDKMGWLSFIIWVSLPEIGAYREYF